MWAGPGAAGSHRSAGVVHELDGISAVGVEITCRRRRRSPAEWLLVHESVAPFGVHHVDGIPVTPVARTLIDLSSFIPKTHLERALEDSLRRRLTSIPSLKMALLQERGRRRAAGALRELILARDPNASPTDSELEVRVLQALAEAGLPPPERQHRVSGPSGFKARLDFAYPEAKIAIEADSYRWHTGRSAFVRDRGRLSVLASLEWRVVLVTWDDLAMKRDGWLGSLRRLYGQQRLL
jgi:hypothetical protein